MPFHWCADETNALLASLPFLGLVWVWLRTRWSPFWNKLLGKKSCECDCHHHDE